MVAFTAKRLPSSKTVAEILRDERLKLTYSREQIAEKAHVSLTYLKNLEDGHYELLPGQVYAKQFIKNLADYYRLSADALIGMYNKECGFHKLILEPKRLSDKNNIVFSWLTPTLIKKSIVSIISLCLLAYMVWEVTAIYRPPKLEINSPQSEQTTDQAFIDINGSTAKNSNVTINEQTVIINGDGSFKQTVNLADGLNKFVITSKREHSETAIKTITILKTSNNSADKLQ